MKYQFKIQYLIYLSKNALINNKKIHVLSILPNLTPKIQSYISKFIQILPLLTFLQK
jgi:hypothetical protein